MLTEDNAPFWEAAAEHRLVIQRCARCHRLHHPPRPMCPSCQSIEQEWIDAAGTGTVYSYTILHHPRHPAFDYPVIAAAIELTEGVRIVSNLIEIDPADVAVGLEVEVAFEATVGAVAGERAVPVFRRRRPS
jgi:uncharacterized protein